MSRSVHKHEVSKIELPQEALSEDRGLKTCGEPILVLASISDSSYYKNDRTSVDGKFDSIEVYLEDKNGNEELAPGAPITYPHQSDTTGFTIDWRQYTEVVGGVTRLKAGCYKIKIYYSVAGIEGFYYYGSYQLLPYSVINAEGTSRIFVVLNGRARENGINYKESGFATTIRFGGKFGYRQPNYDMEDITELNRVTYNVRNESVNTYELRTQPLLSCLTDKIDAKHLLVASQIYISDHNALNHKQFFDLPVILDKEKSPEIDYEGGGLKASITAYFKEKVKNREIKYDGNLEGSSNVILDLPTGTQAEGCVPGTNNIFQSDGTTLIEAVTVPSGSTVNSPVADSPISLNGTFAQNVKATDPKNFLIQNTEGDPVGYVIFGNYEIGVSEITVNTDPFTDLPATQALDIPVHDSANSDVGTVNGGVVDIADTTITVDTNPFDTVVAEGNLDINIVDQNGNSIPSVSSSPNITVVQPNSALLLKTGQTVSYADNDDGQNQEGRLVDFYTLERVPVNLDGSPTVNTTPNRFTDTLGGQTYANNIMIDWSTHDIYTGKILFVSRDIQDSRDWVTQLLYARDTYTAGGFSTWRVFNRMEAESLADTGMPTEMFNYTQLGLPAASYWTSNSFDATDAYRYVSSTGEILRLDKTVSQRAVFVRTGNTSEL